jgi:hypothetical protein
MLFRKERKTQDGNELPVMAVVAGKFKPRKDKKTQAGAFNETDNKEGRKSLPTGLCPWTQRSLTRLHKGTNSFKEVMELRSCDLAYLLADSPPTKPKNKECFATIKRCLTRGHSERGSEAFQKSDSTRSSLW